MSSIVYEKDSLTPGKGDFVSILNEVVLDNTTTPGFPDWKFASFFEGLSTYLVDYNGMFGDYPLELDQIDSSDVNGLITALQYIKIEIELGNYYLPEEDLDEIDPQEEAALAFNTIENEIAINYHLFYEPSLESVTVSLTEREVEFVYENQRLRYVLNITRDNNNPKNFVMETHLEIK